MEWNGINEMNGMTGPGRNEMERAGMERTGTECI